MSMDKIEFHRSIHSTFEESIGQCVVGQRRKIGSFLLISVGHKR